MEGGIMAWEGTAATGPPQAGVAVFSAAADAGEMAALAWNMEENTRKFYLALAGRENMSQANDILLKLAEDEDHHKDALAKVFTRHTGQPISTLTAEWDHNLLEGGIELEAALAWSEGRTFPELMEMAVAMEGNAYDRYLKMIDVVEDEEAKEVFLVISAAEREHLNKLASLI
jgi:rubrerythrin